MNEFTQILKHSLDEKKFLERRKNSKFFRIMFKIQQKTSTKPRKHINFAATFEVKSENLLPDM